MRNVLKPMIRILFQFLRFLIFEMWSILHSKLNFHVLFPKYTEFRLGHKQKNGKFLIKKYITFYLTESICRPFIMSIIMNIIMNILLTIFIGRHIYLLYDSNFSFLIYLSCDTNIHYNIPLIINYILAASVFSGNHI